MVTALIAFSLQTNCSRGSNRTSLPHFIRSRCESSQSSVSCWAYSLIYRDFNIAKFTCFIRSRICRDSKTLLNSRHNYEEVDFFPILLIPSRTNLQWYQVWKPNHLNCVYTPFVFMNWWFRPDYWEDRLIGSVRPSVCLCTSVSNVTVPCAFQRKIL